MRSGNPPPPRRTIGRDESGADYTVLYADTRGVSLVCEGLLKLWRNSPDFSQRFEGHVDSAKTRSPPTGKGALMVPSGSETSTSPTHGSSRAADGSVGYPEARSTH